MNICKYTKNKSKYPNYCFTKTCRNKFVQICMWTFKHFIGHNFCTKCNKNPWLFHLLRKFLLSTLCLSLDIVSIIHYVRAGLKENMHQNKYTVFYWGNRISTDWKVLLTVITHYHAWLYFFTSIFWCYLYELYRGHFMHAKKNTTCKCSWFKITKYATY